MTSALERLVATKSLSAESPDAREFEGLKKVLNHSGFRYITERVIMRRDLQFQGPRDRAHLERRVLAPPATRDPGSCPAKAADDQQCAGHRRSAGAAGQPA